MSIASVQSRINEIQAQIASYAAKPKEKFSAVLKEKTGLLVSDISKTAENNSEQTEQDDGFTPLVATQTTLGAATNISQALINQLNNGDYSGYNPSCPECAAEMASTYGALQNGIADYSVSLPENLSGAAPYMEYIQEASQRYGMPVNLIVGIMKAESDFNNECVSYAGAKGLMQLMPETAAEVGVTDVFDPRQNILGSVEYITKLVNKYNGDIRLALAAYNTGPAKIAQRGVTSSTSAEYETVPQSIRDYAQRVLKYAGYVTD